MGINAVENIKKYNLKLTKSLGQNFLRDDNIIRKIINAAEVTKDDLIIEIGPGVGSMTLRLAEKAGMVAAVEIDKRLILPLKENLKEFDNVDIINADILKMDINKDLLDKYRSKLQGFKNPSIKVVANLPYYITTPIIMKFLEEAEDIDLMVFTLQKEVADRIIAEPGNKDYGALSVAVQYYSKPRRMFDISPECFVPCPEVESTVIRMDIYKEPYVKLIDKKVFFKTVKAAFGQRRKTLLNALHNSGIFELDKKEMESVIKSLGIDPGSRGETLTIMQFAELSNSLSNKDC
jgi:16S rRNA (adenine1518-N6/adenine1519-N6)-dimethyltransferase